ncbi:hypothetical protein [Sphingobacterium paludis]|jgi:hypothetical protein|uniref:Uncharacterized protein n=1 Tax=Sphingobacterium paludis TaxID=1476465 RepID=A0A4R7CY81_9SPHI|nr:hypothetical protein [Sphingobacterium paludis]TDS13270.1 hypothetical protein B0I21_105406 [Sphingobacterium paludis]
MKTENKKQQGKIQLIVAFAVVEPFFDVPETNGPEENQENEVAGTEPIDNPLERERENLGIDDVDDPEPVKESDLADLEPIDPNLEEMDEEDDYADLEEE